MPTRLTNFPAKDHMKRFLAFCSLAALGLGYTAMGQPSASYINSGSISSPVNIDATNFLNLGTMDFSIATTAFNFYDVQHYTNKNVMTSSLGWIFDFLPSGAGNEGPSKVFVNTSPAVITASTPSERLTDVHGEVVTALLKDPVG